MPHRLNIYFNESFFFSFHSIFLQFLEKKIFFSSRRLHFFTILFQVYILEKSKRRKQKMMF